LGLSGVLAPAGRSQECLPLAEVASFGRGTPGAAGVPELLVVGGPFVGQPGPGLRVVHGAPHAIAQIVVGAAGMPTPLPGFGATLYVAPPLARVPVRLDDAGTSPSLFQTPVPTSPTLCGLTFAAQGVVIDPAAQGGAAFTAGATLRFGTGLAAAGLFDITAHYLVPGAGKTARPAFAVADVDNNGCPDLLVPTGAGSVSDLRVLRQLADGTLAPPLAFPLMQTAGAVDIVVADLDDDGLLDVATAHSSPTSSSVLLLRGTGDGGFLPFEVLGPAPGGKSLALAAGDVTGDGRADLIVAGWTAPSIAVLAGPIGPGPAGPAALIAVPAPPIARGTRLGDVDGDGLTDVIALVGPPSALLVTRSLGGGAFDAPAVWPVDLVTALAVDARDIDLDGDCDAVVAANPSGTQEQLEVLLSDGSGGLASGLHVELPPAPSSPVEVALGDLDGDALPEILVTWGNTLGMRLTNLGAGAFGPAEEIDYTGTLTRLADMDGDGRADLVTVNQPLVLSMAWWQAGDGAGGFLLPSALPDGMPQGATHAADLDGDGDLDLLAWPNAGILPSVLGVTLNDGQAHFGPATLYDTGGSVRDVVVADMDDDGVLDVVAAAGAVGAAIFPGLGDGTLGAPVLVAQPATLVVRVADMDGDGLPELILGSTFFPSALRVYPNLGGLAFGAPAESPLPVQPRVFDVGDLDGDGIPEAVVQAGSSVLVLAGTAAPAFDPPVTLSDPHGGSGTDFPLHLADVDGDGDVDMLRRTFGVMTQVWRNDGSGALSKVQAEWWEAWGPLSVADVNGDGAPDIVGEGVMLGLGNGLFTAPQPGGVANVDGDLDGDGHPDGAAFGRLFLNRSQ
jgi:hypothetical protein